MPTANTKCHWRTAGETTGPSNGGRPRPHRPIGRPRCPRRQKRPWDRSRPSDRTALVARGRPQSDGQRRQRPSPVERPRPTPADLDRTATAVRGRPHSDGLSSALIRELHPFSSPPNSLPCPPLLSTRWQHKGFLEIFFSGTSDISRVVQN